MLNHLCPLGYTLLSHVLFFPTLLNRFANFLVCLHLQTEMRLAYNFFFSLKPSLILVIT